MVQRLYMKHFCVHGYIKFLYLPLPGKSILPALLNFNSELEYIFQLFQEPFNYITEILKLNTNSLKLQ